MDETKRPVRVPSDFASYASKHEVFQLFEGLLKAVLVERPKEPLSFMRKYLQRRPVVNVIVAGPPAAGTHTLATALAQKGGQVHVEARKAVQDAVDARTDLGLLAIPFLSSASHSAFEVLDEKIPDAIVVPIVAQRLLKEDCVNRGWILTGMPSNRQQALALQMAGILCTHFIALDLSDATVLQRVKDRVVDEAGNVYHTKFIPPPEGVRVSALDSDKEEIVAQRLKTYRRNVFGLVAAYKSCIKTISADQPPAEVVSKAWEFLCTKAHSNAPLIPRILLFGASGSGRTAQAQLLAAKYGVVAINAETLVKKHMASDSKLGLALKPYQGREALIPDNLLTRVISERLWEHDAVTKGWVLEGFPTTRSQAESLAKAGFEASHAMFLDAPDETLVERLSLRRVDPVTGKAYHLLYAPPPSLDIQTRLKMNPKDRDDEIVKRIGGYKLLESELRSFYKPIAHAINADEEVQTVFEAIEAAMVTPVTANPVPR